MWMTFKERGLFFSAHKEMSLLFTMYVNDEYAAKKMESACKKLGKKLGHKTEMKWQWVRNGEKLVIACDFYKDD